MSESLFRPLTLALLLGAQLGAPGSAAQQRSERSVPPDSLSAVSGVVTDHENGRPVSGAAISLVSRPGPDSPARTAASDDVGHFDFQRLRPGLYRFSVSRLGYRTVEDSLSVPPGVQIHIQAELSTLPIDLEPIAVVVRGRRERVIPGLEGRELRGVGTILTRERIEATKALHVSDVLRIVPGVRLVPEDDLGYTVRLRGGCRPAIWIDDARTQSIDVDALILPSDIEAIEVYHASEIPARFGQDPCGAVVFWTRTAKPGTGRASAWKRIVLSAAVLTAMFWRFY